MFLLLSDPGPEIASYSTARADEDAGAPSASGSQQGLPAQKQTSLLGMVGSAIKQIEMDIQRDRAMLTGLNTKGLSHRPKKTNIGSQKKWS